MGLAVSSPMLALGEGRRRIEITLGFDRRQEATDPETMRPGATDRAGGASPREAVAGVILSDPAMIEPFGIGVPEAAVEIIAGWVEALVAETGLAPTLALLQQACLRAATTPDGLRSHRRRHPG